MRKRSGKGNIIPLFVAVLMFWMLSCSVFEGLQAYTDYQQAVALQNNTKTAAVSDDGMRPDATENIMRTDPAATANPGRTPSPSWSPGDCSGWDFLRYEIKDQVEEAYAGNNVCAYDWHITNVDDTVHIRLYRLAFVKYESTGVVYDNEWLSTGTLKPGEVHISRSWLESLDSGTFYSTFTKLAAIVDLDQCEWVWKGKRFDLVAVEVPQPCAP